MWSFPKFGGFWIGCFSAQLISSAIVFFVLAAIPGIEARAQSRKRILVFASLRQDSPIQTAADRTLLKALRDGLNSQLDYYNEYIDEPRFSDPQYVAALREFVGRKYAGQHFDLVITLQRPALSFVTAYGQDLFPNTPVFFIAGKGLEIANERPRPNFTGVLYKVDLRPQLEIALRLQPNLKHIFAITGASVFDQHYEQGAKDQWREFEGRLQFAYSSGQTIDELKQRVAHLSADSAVYLVTMSEDRNGNRYLAEEIVDQLAPVASVPVYTLSNVTLDQGAIGGRILSFDKIFAQAAPLALRVLRGERAEDIPVTEISPTVLEFNWGQLQRFGIDENHLPAGSVVLFREATFWERYRGRVVVVAVLLVLQAALIGALLVERRRKKRAALSLAGSEERFAKAFRGNPQPMSITNLAEGRYLDVNESFTLMSGYSREEIIGRTSLELALYSSPEHRAAILVDPLLKTGATRNVEMDFRTKSGDFRMLLSSSELIELGGEKCIVIASSDITERKKVERELAELTGRLLRTQDEERRNIARELHDVTAQSIGLIMLNLGQMQNGTYGADKRIKDKLSESLTFGEQALKDIRTLSYVLHPPLLDQAGLLIALEWLAKGFSERSGIKVSFTENGSDGHRMPPEVEYAFYRVVQECLTNIRRHTNSETAEINLLRSPDEVRLTVRDHGKGHKFYLPKNGDDVESVGVGIPGMRYRLKQLGGDLTVDSNLNNTTVTATVPVRWVIYDSDLVS